VERNNRAMLAQMIQTAWEQKFGGGMDRLSQSWDGMMSNLADAWSRFQQMIMNSGVFDWLRDRLERLLRQIDRLASDGTLQQWADRIAAAVIRVFEALERLLTDGDLRGRLGRASPEASRHKTRDRLQQLRAVLQPEALQVRDRDAGAARRQVQRHRAGRLAAARRVHRGDQVAERERPQGQLRDAADDLSGPGAA
jgi:phage tail tape-measure protein